MSAWPHLRMLPAIGRRSAKPCAGSRREPPPTEVESSSGHAASHRTPLGEATPQCLDGLSQQKLQRLVCVLLLAPNRAHKCTHCA
eukprot:3323651-Lingulodinium_polyedra.AAC.1